MEKETINNFSSHFLLALFISFVSFILFATTSYSYGSAGTLKWKCETGNHIDSSPAIGTDGTVYVGSRNYVYTIPPDDYLYAINPDGTLKWRYKTDSNVYSSPAIGVDGTVYIGSDDDYLYAINSDGTLKWRYKTGYEIDSSPAIGVDGTVYVGSEDDYLYAINSDGTLKWRYWAGWIYSSSPAIGVDGTVYVGSRDGHLYAINSDGTLKWRYWTGTGGYIDSSPAIGVDGTVYVGSFYYLYAINGDSGGLANSPWPKFHHDNQNTGLSTTSSGEQPPAPQETQTTGYPSNPLPALPTVNPVDTTVVASPAKIMVKPSLTVPEEDQGQQAQLLMYIYLPDYKTGIPLFNGPTVTLGNIISFDSFFPDPIDCSACSGLTADIYYGYVLPEGKIRFNAYKLKISQ